jgi:hypothetical protein
MKQFNSDFLAVSFNCTGIRTSKDQLQRLLEEIGNCLGSRPRAVVLQECFLTKADILSLKIQGYRAIVATEGMETKNGHRRGSAIFVDLFLNVQPLKERTVGKVEMVGVRIAGDTEKTFKNPFELWTAYSGPWKKEALVCKKMLVSLCKERNSRLLLAGDLNSDLAPGGSEACKAIRECLEKMEAEGQARILNEYGEKTTTTPNGSVLDLAVTMGNWEVGFAYPMEWHLGSTHYPVCIGVATGESKSKHFQYESIPRYKRTEKTATELKRMCKAINEEIQEHTGDSLSQAILDAMTNCALDKSSKKKKKKKKQHKHWWNDEIELLFQEKQNHLRKFGKDDQFKAIDEKLTLAISKAKNESFQQYATQLDHRNQNSDVYRAIKYVGSRRPSKVAELTIIGKDGKVVTDMREKANVLSRRYQVPLGHHPTKDPLRKKQLKDTRKQREQESPCGTDHILFSVAEARVAREYMANNKAPGPSRIRKEDLEMGGDDMDKLVAELANKVALSGEWPKILKKQIVCPMPKEEEAVDVIEEDKTRPISLLEVLDKWVQRIIYNRIIQYIEYDEAQAGYCLSCDHHTSLVSDFAMNRTDDAYTLAVFTDIAKAFDSVPLDELIDVIWGSSIPPAYAWVLSSFVENRQFRVEIRDDNGNVAASQWRKMIYGTPQGSVLGPLLWNLFFDPLLKQLADHSNKSNEQNVYGENATNILEDIDTAFADDLTLLAASIDPRKAEKLLESKLDIFASFLKRRNMEAAAHKLKVMCLDPQKRKYSPLVHFEGKPIEVVSTHKFLGIFYDKDMTFEEHWKNVVTSVANRTKIMAMLRGAKWGPTQQTMRVLHQSYIESKIRYGMPAWYPFLAKNLKDKLEAYLNRSIRIVMGLTIHCWNDALLAESDLDSVADLAIKSMVSLYVRINPTDHTQTTLVKKKYRKKVPKWASLLKEVPENILEGPIQAKLSKKAILATDKVCVREKTLETQEEANTMEKDFSSILYTDASVDISSEPPGKAVIGYIWYKKHLGDSWEEVCRCNASIGSEHSSYSAEAIAIWEGLSNNPNIESASNAAIGIFTDSLSNLKTIKKGIAETPEQEALLRSIADHPSELVFHHVRSHQNNKKNNDVDEICNVRINHPDRKNFDHLGGKKTVTKIKSWMKDWVRNKRLRSVMNNKTAQKRGSATQRWMIKILTDEKNNIQPPPRLHKNLPRRKGILLAKARTNRWTQCNWYLHFIKKVSSPLCKLCKVSDTTEHALDECSLHEHHRELMLQNLHSTGKVSDLLTSSNKEIVNTLAEYLVRIEDDRKKIEKEYKEKQLQ